MKPEAFDALGSIVAFLLTVMVFSYLAGDNPLYRIAMHLFIGVAAGFATLVLVQNVILPQLVFGTMDAVKVVSTDPLPLVRLIVPILLCILLSLKLSAGLAPWSNIAMAFMVGVGSAVAVGGAITGTIFGQVSANWINPLKEKDQLLGVIQAGVLLVGVSLTLMYFFYTAQALPGGRTDRPLILKPLAWGGQFFIQTALAALYVGTLAATLTVFTERTLFLINFLTNLPALFASFGS